jgi:hypothetical protein
MLKHVSWKLPLAILFGITTIHANSQIAPSAQKGNFPLVLGGGISDFSLDYGLGRRMEGITAWADWRFTSLPGRLRGLGIEAEGRDLNLNRPTTLPKMRQDTGQGGLTYTLRTFHNLSPYAKMLGGIGSIDFPDSHNPLYTHDTFSIFSPGGGAEYRIWSRVWVRGDYEYQFWHQTFGPHDLNPNGVTIGATYHFGYAPGETR